VTRYTVFGKATKCPNCHAYLTGHGEQIRCEYCGVTVTVEAPQGPPTGPGVTDPPVVLRAPDPTVLVRAPKVRTWPYFLVAPLMTGGILYYSYFMQRQALDRTTAVTQEAQAHAAEIQREAQARAGAIADEKPDVLPGAPVKPGKNPKIDPICHLSAMEIQTTLDEQSKVVAACFDEAPKKIKKIQADLELVVEPSGKVADVDIAWDGWKPEPKMRKCATRKIRAWKMAKPSGDIPTRCQARLSVEPP
jgi:hypothetical protein